MKIKCIYCGNFLSSNYYLKHLKTKKHINTKKKIIDEALLFLPKDINGIIFEYFDDTPLEIRRYKTIRDEEEERLKIEIRIETERTRIANIWYNKYPRKCKNFIYKIFNPYD